MSDDQSPDPAIDQAKKEYLQARTAWYELPVRDDNYEDVASFHDNMTEKLNDLIAAVQQSSASRLQEVEKELAITRLSIPLEEELTGQIDEMCKHLSMQDGYTLHGIARLLIDVQRRMAADWLEIGRLRRETLRLQEVETELRELKAKHAV